jgi:hypothetical protein
VEIELAEIGVERIDSRKYKIRMMVLDDKVFAATDEIGEPLKVESVMNVERKLGRFGRKSAESV